MTGTKEIACSFQHNSHVAELAWYAFWQIYNEIHSASSSSARVRVREGGEFTIQFSEHSTWPIVDHSWIADFCDIECRLQRQLSAYEPALDRQESALFSLRRPMGWPKWGKGLNS